MNDDIHALSGAYAVDAVDERERALFEAHLAECAECRAEVAGLREAAAQLSALSADAVPPPALRERVLDEITRVRPLPPLPDGASGEPPAVQATDDESPAVPLRRRRWFPAALVGAAAAIVLVGGVVIDQATQDETSQVQLTVADRVLAAPDAERVSLDLDGASATLVRSRAEHRAVLVTRGMPAAPQGRVYQLWLQTPQGTMRPAGLMPAGSDQKVVLDGDASRAIGAGITVEPEGGSQQPTTEPIALFDLGGGQETT